jgi:hypothetical protein
MNSYQRRLKEIKFKDQCIAELEQICIRIVKANYGIVLPLGASMEGDDSITPYNMGGFCGELALHLVTDDQVKAKLMPLWDKTSESEKARIKTMIENFTGLPFEDIDYTRDVIAIMNRELKA